MKKLIASLMLSGLFLISCDKVKHPDQRPPVIPHCVDSIHAVVKTNTLTSNSRKVLLEDYTGHLCPNCPDAAAQAESLESTYGNNLVVIANHVSTTFARPFSDSTYKEDFRSPSSTAWDTEFGMSIAGLPKGSANRVGGPQNFSAWSALVATAMAKPQSARLDITSSYDTVKHYINIKVKTTFKTVWPNDVNLVVLFTQDSIISDQKNFNPPPGATMDPFDPVRRLNYRFDHIVIDAFNGDAGELVKAGPVLVNDTLTKSYGCYLLNKCFFNKTNKPTVCLNDRHINVVAFVYDVATKEILQAEKLKIR